MTAPIPPLGLPRDAAAAARLDQRLDPRLQQSARALEGLFVQQLFAAMRETVPQDGPLSGGPGEEMFTAMLHEHLAELAPARWTHGLSADLAAQLARPDAGPAEAK